jgi:hypothetical protein
MAKAWLGVSPESVWSAQEAQQRGVAALAGVQLLPEQHLAPRELVHGCSSTGKAGHRCSVF